MSEATLPMPANDPQQSTGWIAAALAAAGVVVGAIFKGAFDALTGKWSRQTTLEVKAVDSRDGYTDDLRDDVKQLRLEFREAQVAMDTLRREAEAERRASQSQMDIMRNEGLDKSKRIAHLEIEIEKLTNQLSQMQDEGRKRQQEHEELVTALQSELAEKNALILALREQIKDMEVIGVGEKSPPARRKE